MKNRKIDLMLDSGAYSAFTRNAKLPLSGYIEFLHKWLPYLDSYVALDVIATGDPEASAKKSFENYKEMKSAGLDPIPVYHFGEGKKWLHNLLDSGATYIGLGGVARVGRTLRNVWIKQAFREIPDDVRVHGFGITDVGAMVRYPFYSVDSTSWMQMSSNGSIIVPARLGEPMSKGYVVGTLNDNESVGKRRGAIFPNHVTRMGPAYLKALDRYIKEVTNGKSDLSRVQGHYTARRLACAAFFKNLTEKINDTREFKFYFGLPPGFRYSEDWALNEMGCRNRLQSYAGIIDRKKPLTLDHYVVTGASPAKKVSKNNYDQKRISTSVSKSPPRRIKSGVASRPKLLRVRGGSGSRNK